MRAHPSRSAQRGVLQQLILPALILLGVVLAQLGLLTQQNMQGRLVARNVDEARAQLTLIQDALRWCRITYPTADNGSGIGRLNYPAGANWSTVRTLVCPGASTSTLFVALGPMLPAAPSLLGEWEYRNNASGISLRISTRGAGDTFGRAVLTQMASRLDASQYVLAGDTLTLSFVQ